MTKTVERYEKVRADWLLAHEASWHLSDRRMANELKRRAANKDRAAAGAAESSHHEGKIKPIASRFVAGGEDSKERGLRALFLILFILPTLVVWIGPALAISHAAYSVGTERRLKQGRVPERRQWYLAAAAVAGAGALFALIARFVALHLITVATVTYWPSLTLDVHWTTVGLIYLWVQVVLGLLLAAWQIRRHGWPGVVIKAGAKTPEVPATPRAPVAPAVPTAPKSVGSGEITAEEPDGEPAAPRAPAVPIVPTIPEPPVVAGFDDDPVFDDENDEYRA
ncbi:hypothetical protein [Brevibacterium linens]|uniref:Uncharacterized protein n=1 Tax=Brevibacterium linens TaxID=1703 RepID=A0A2H1KHL8_BRELN|nr:hypothetical protein [Brevibacterium linens]SMX99058.1 hypothetical protein BLIN101_03345 [Brevibacterium linens]